MISEPSTSGGKQQEATAIHPGYAHAGQYQTMPCFTPSLRKDGLKHNILVLLNIFRIGLLNPQGLADGL
jgi:hypothetical protein